MLVLDADTQRLKYPESIAWLDGQNLWLKEAAEYNLLRQLLIVTDAWVGENSDYAHSTQGGAKFLRNAGREPKALQSPKETMGHQPRKRRYPSGSPMDKTRS